jgi:hypothetical protein
VLGLYYARHTTAEDHQAPFDFMVDVFLKEADKALLWACRGGGKTISFAVLYLLNTYYKDNFDIVHIGGTETQSKQGYAYYAGDPNKDGQTGFVRLPAFQGKLSEAMVTKTALKNGSRLEIRTGGSSKSVSGPHPNMLGVDELDHISMSVLDTAMQMPMSKGPYRSQTVMGSSQYARFGTLRTLVQQAPKRGVKVYKYDLFDIMESCGRTYPSGCGACPFFVWTNPYTGEEEELCTGRGAQADGHYTYKDALNKLMMTQNLESFALQMLLLQGTSQGLMISSFNKDKHVKAFPPEGADLSRWRAFGGVDLRSHGRVEIVAESPDMLPNGRRMRWVIREWQDDSATPSKIRGAALELRGEVLREYGLDVTVFWMEPSASDEAADWKRGRTVPKEVRQVRYRVGQMRDHFLDVSNINSLLIDPSCTDLIFSLSEGYMCKQKPDGTFDRDRPADEFSHAPDALGYALVGGPIGASMSLPDQITRAGWWDFGGGDFRQKWEIR